MSRFFKKSNKLQIESKPRIESINPNVTDMINRLAQSKKPPTEPALGSTASSSASPNIVGPNEQMENDPTAQPPKENDVGRAPPGKQRRNNWMCSTVSIGQDEAYNQVCNFLQDVEVGMVGIYGMGGVGKTTLMKKIEREFLKPYHFKVIWIVVSREVDMDMIQKVIMGSLNLAFNEHDHSRADKINAALQNNNVAILFDDIWNHLDLEQLGIFDLDTRTFKLIFTTRSKAVCDEMQSDELINVQPLGWDDSWALFKRSVGSNNDIESWESSVVELAKEVARECKGLPLALKVIGRAMASRRRLEEWRHALATLQHYPADIPAAEGLFTPLKLSFDSLSNQREKGCFLYTCFYPEDRVMEADMLIECWIGEGILTLNGSYQEAFDDGMNIFGTLKAACLFETLQDSKDSKDSTRIHDVIRDMGKWIANSHEITDKTESRRYSVWCEDNILPEEAICSNLTTLIIDREGIWFYFSLFKSMSKLRVIKLKGITFVGNPTSIGKLTELRHLELIKTDLERLPDEIRNLRKLQVMYFQEMLFDLPEAIGELTELRRLVCSTDRLRIARRRLVCGTGNIPAERDLKKLPVEVGNLKKLEELRIDSYLLEFPQVIRQLVNLKKLFLKIRACVELPLGLKNLNKLQIFELDKGDSFHCVELIPNDTFRNMHKLSELSLPIKNFKILPPSFFQGLTSLKRLSFRYQGSDSDEDKHMYDDVASFLTQLSSLPLRILKIKSCPIKKFQVPPTSNDLCFPCLEELHICDFDRLEKMQVMSQMAFPSIQVLKITCCHSLKHISGLEHLQSLVELKINGCRKLEEVIQVAGDKTLSDHSPGICFPKLEKLWLAVLPQMKSICNDAISFPSLRYFCLVDCSELRVLPRGLPSIRVVDISFCHSQHISGLDHLQSLVELEIRNCNKLEEVIRVAGDKSLSDHSPGICFPKLEKLGLEYLPQLKSIFSDAISFPSLMSQMALPSIRVLKFRNCNSLKHICGLEHLQSLVELEIRYCRELEEVIQVAGDKTLSVHSPGICFPKLEKLDLDNLPQLKSICSDAISFPSLRELHLDDCPLLRVLPIGLVKENKAPERCLIGGGREWYNKLHWQDEDFKAALDPHFKWQILEVLQKVQTNKGRRLSG